MKLQIRIGNHIRPVVVPNSLVCNRLAVRLLVGIVNRKGIPISAAQIERLMAQIVDYGKNHPEWIPVQIQFCDGKEAYLIL